MGSEVGVRLSSDAVCKRDVRERTSKMNLWGGGLRYGRRRKTSWVEVEVWKGGETRLHWRGVRAVFISHEERRERRKMG